MWKRFWSWLLPLSDNDWVDGYPPPHIPRSFIDEGMYTCSETRKIIPCWRYNATYYVHLVD